MTQELPPEEVMRETEAPKLPSVGVLISRGWQYTKNHLALVGILSAPLIVMHLSNYLEIISPGSGSSSPISVFQVVSLLAFIAYTVLMAAALYLVTHNAQTPLFADGFAWAKKHYWSVLWVSVITTLVAWGGLVPLLVPGIIVAVYLVLSQIVLATEGHTGMSALLRSRELVYGNWVAVCLRVVGMNLVFLFLFFLIFLGIGIVVGLTTISFGYESLNTLLMNVSGTIFGSIVTLMFLHATHELYIALKTKKESTQSDDVPPAAVKYKALAWWGLAAIVLAVVLTSVAESNREFMVTQEGSRADSVLQTDLELVQSQASQYYASQPEPSFQGVCSEVQSVISAGGEVVCSESKEAYALTVQQGGVLYCVDSTGYNKRVYTNLNERTQCLDI